MNSTVTENLDQANNCYLTWQPIVVIILQVLGLGFSSVKYYRVRHELSTDFSILDIFLSK